MEQHPIPQQISSYQFRLVGDMTLKQFFQVAGGALISLLIYATGLHPIVKWPLIIFFFSMGLAFAFLPFEERPLSQWIFSFFRSIYSPTVHVWTTPAKKHVFFKEETLEKPKEDDVITPHGEVQLEKYLNQPAQGGEKHTTNLETAEKSFLQKVMGMFSQPHPPKEESVDIAAMQVPATPVASNTDQNIQVSKLPKEKEKKDVQIPKQKIVSIGFDGRPKIVIEEQTGDEKSQQVKKPVGEMTQVEPTLKEKPVEAKEAQFSINAAPPHPATIPNTVVGQVMDPDGRIIEGAILEIRDMAGRPVRALRSNKAGHFIIVTALQDGFYEIVPEKEGYEFEPVQFEAKGEIIPPIAIRAKKLNEQELYDAHDLS